MKNKPIFFIIGGEQSADNHGAALMQAMQKLNPRVKFIGIGGKNMIASGLESLENINKLAIMGFAEIIKHLYFFWDLTNRILDVINTTKPDQIILIDYPGFNLRLAKKIKKKFNIPITYYISPQIWAWKENRIKIVQKYIDQMLVIFPFEKKWYKERGVQAQFVGHPIFDEWSSNSRVDLCDVLKLDSEKPIITLYPGSRKQEFNRHLILFLQVAEKIKNKNKEAQFILGLAPELEVSTFTIPNWVKVENKYPQKALECADFSLVASGSATLEAAIFGTPMVIVYKMSSLSWILSKLLVKTKYAGMVNIIAGKKIVPEYLQKKATIKSISKECLNIINNKDIYKKMKKEFKNIETILRSDSASKKAAEHILSLYELR
tara:strand:+ start:7778 stop:8908 length:1131 start_codon:yes stop_codon:yes gene_type:complete